MTPVTSSATGGERVSAEQAYEVVDPRAPRFGQTITTLGLVGGIALREPLLVYAISAILVVSALSRWRLDLYGFLWRNAMRRVLGGPDETEAAAPHRFAKLLGAVFTAVASVLLLAGGYAGVSSVVIAGYAVAGSVAVLAFAAASFDYCLGCKMYRQVSFFRRLGWV
jgi:hypothetical protein